MLKLPYGRRDFYEVITEGYHYLDRTHHIAFIEDWGKELLFLRPRRMGKSLWLSTLMNYYDVAKAADFERLFGHLAIGKRPTPLHNQYMVMRWDFSVIPAHGSVAQIEYALNGYLNEWIAIFADNYQGFLQTEIRINTNNALISFMSAVAAANATPYKLYLFIDEYDNFANEVMMSTVHGNDERYETLVTGEELFKTFFKNVKDAGSGAGLDRVFITGVSPIVMNDVSSGANVFEDIYWFQELNDLCGFRESEVANMLAQVIEARGFPIGERASKQAEALDMMRIYYDGSWFTTEVPPPNKLAKRVNASGSNSRQADQISPAGSHLYNPTMVFYFLRYLQRTAQYPDQMLDPNLQADRGKLAYIAHYGMGRTVLIDSFNRQQDISVSTIGTQFGAEEMLQDNMLDNRLASLLCYLGALTINGRADNGNILLTIPNLVMKNSYAEQIQEMAIRDPVKVRSAQNAANSLFGQGQLQPLCDFLEENLMSIYDNRDYPQFKELTLKSLFIAILHQNNLYIMYSEPAFGRRYGDLLLWLRPEKQGSSFFNPLFEFKQLPLNKIVEVPNVLAQSGKPKKALSGEAVKAKSQAELLAIPAVKAAMEEAKAQLRDYQQVLLAQYGAGLKLRSYAVVGVGLERVVFECFEIPAQ